MASFLTLVKTWWPIVSMIVSLLSGMHAASSKAAASDGSMSITAQATHVLGAGALSGVALIAGAAGVISNHRAAAAAPSKPAAGVDPIAHQLSVTHTIMVENGGTPAEFDQLNTLVKGRVAKL